MEKATLNINTLRITQKANSNFSHKGDKAIDIAGTTNLGAPFTGTIKRIYKYGNCVWLESNDKVKYADGTIDYMTILTMHDNDISNLYVGKKINQGQIYYQEGKAGNATGNHIHIAVGKGKFTGNGWYKNSDGVWCINNQINIYDALYLPKNIKKVNDGEYNWRYLSDEIIKNDVYIVKPNDTLYAISRKFNVNLKELVKINNIKNPNRIYVDQKLIIPINKITYYDKYIGNTVSIVDALKSMNEDYSYKRRKAIALLNNINSYVGTATQNKKLLELLKTGKLIKIKN